MEKKLPDFNSISPIERLRLEEKNKKNTKNPQNSPSTAKPNPQFPSTNKSDPKFKLKPTAQYKTSNSSSSLRQSPKKPIKKPAKYLVYSLEEILETYEDYLNNSHN